MFFNAVYATAVPSAGTKTTATSDASLFCTGLDARGHENGRLMAAASKRRGRERMHVYERGGGKWWRRGAVVYQLGLNNGGAQLMAEGRVRTAYGSRQMTGGRDVKIVLWTDMLIRIDSKCIGVSGIHTITSDSSSSSP